MPIFGIVKEKNMENKPIRIECTPKQKASLSEIFKNGENFQFKKVDYNSPKITAECEKLRRMREKRLLEERQPFENFYFNV